MQTHELKPVVYEDLRARVEWQIKCLYYRYAVAQALRYAIVAQMQRKGVIDRFLKTEFEKQLATAESGEILAGVKAEIGVKRFFIQYENVKSFNRDCFSFEVRWYQTDPFPFRALQGSGRQTQAESVTIYQMHREPNEDEMHRCLGAYATLDKDRYTLAASLGGLEDACKRFNRAYEEIVGACQYGGGTYPLSQYFPFYSNSI